jgi:hypothetical protein
MSCEERASRFPEEELFYVRDLVRHLLGPPEERPRPAPDRPVPCVEDSLVRRPSRRSGP